MDLREFEVSLVYRVNSRIAGATHRNPVSKKLKKKKKPWRLQQLSPGPCAVCTLELTFSTYLGFKRDVDSELPASTALSLPRG
uniref:Uncharacterized protein n=1 Tax=Peromyscus maniculatus bairdii TaxID=230844 RepID=A0A8C8W867_PERMB